ncbi:MAG: hypothetical protein DMG71_14415, partial [Acidobacteria bacterium]
ARGIGLGQDEADRILKFCDTLPDTMKPSLLLDLEAGRPTEIDDLSGAVSRIGRMAGVETPIHDTAVVALGAAQHEGKSSSGAGLNRDDSSFEQQRSTVNASK